MHKRFIVLAALVLFVGLVTHVFAAGTETGGITRAGAVALVVESDPALKTRLAYFIKNIPPLPLFDDLDYTQWYAPYIETAFEAGIVTGNPEGKFRPGDFITEEEAIVLGARFHARKNTVTATELKAQNAGGEWFDVPLNAAMRGGLSLPTPVRIGQPMTRSHYHAMLTSAGIVNPEQIAINAPKPAVVVAAMNYPNAVQPSTRRELRPLQQSSRASQARVAPQPVAPRPVQPVVPQPAPAQPPASAKNFAITMPSLGITDLTITHPSDPFTKDGLLAPLKNGVGHLFSLPGKGGKILIYGHSSSYPWDVSNFTKIFRQINKLAVGDTIYVTYGGKQHAYKVSYKQTVPASDMSVYQRGSGEELILYTCWPPDSIKERYLVHAKPIAEMAAR